MIQVAKNNSPNHWFGLLVLLACCTMNTSLAQLSEGITPAANAELIYQLQQLQDEVRELRGMLEQQSFELENIKRRQRDQYMELDQRLSGAAVPGAAVRGSALDAGGARQSADATQALPADTQSQSPQTPAQQSATASSGAPAVALPQVREPLQDQRQITTVTQPVLGNTQAIAAPPQSVQAAYDQAFDALKALRYSEAAGLFRDFIQQHPDSELAPNAYYWLGESYYASSNYDLALASFNDVMERYPNNSKAGDALLKIGYTHYEKQQWLPARAALEQVKVQYAGTALARLADSRLRSMRAEGKL